MDEHEHSKSSRAASEFWPRVTIFRDTIAVAALRGVLQRAIAGRHDDRGFRVWIPGCDGGELVYAAAAVVRDAIARAGAQLVPRIFATDHDPHALRRARDAWFPTAIERSIAPDLLARHFERADNGYRPSRALRSKCVFAQHDLLCNPPLHRLDLVVCGELPGALEHAGVDRLFRVFRFALRPGGVFVVDPALNLADERFYVAELPEHGVFRARGERTACAHEEMQSAQEEARIAHEELVATNLALQAEIEKNERLRRDLAEVMTDVEVARGSLQTQARQQRAIAELGVLALKTPIEELFARTVELVQGVLSLSCCEILVFDPLSSRLSLAASVGWPRGEASEHAGPGAPAHAAMARRDPDVTRVTAPHLVEAGLARTLCASIRDDGSVYGLLRGQATDGIVLGPDEIELASTAASILGRTIGRHHATKRLQEQSRQKDEFLAMLGHELRNPLAAIANASELQEESGDGTPLMEKTTAVIRRQVVQMVRIIDDLLDVARFARGKVVLEREPIDLGALVRSAVEDHDDLTRSGLELELVMSAKPVVVQGDRERLLQVLNNLLTNAVQFTDPPGTITVALAAHDGFAELRVEDTGCGIDPEFLSHLFEPFRQAPQTLADKRGGLGLGLALVEQIVAQLGGRVQAESAGPGRGATFRLWLPRAEAATSQSAARDEAPSSLRILVVEDNEDVATMLAGMLELAGHQVTVAYDAREGLEAARQREIDVVLCDLGLPGELDGFDFAENLRGREHQEIPALISISGYGRHEDFERAHRAGFDLHLVKPVEFADLQRAIGDAMHHRVSTSPV